MRQKLSNSLDTTASPTKLARERSSLTPPSPPLTPLQEVLGNDTRAQTREPELLLARMSVTSARKNVAQPTVIVRSHRIVTAGVRKQHLISAGKGVF
jgi:hypothetical protein